MQTFKSNSVKDAKEFIRCSARRDVAPADFLDVTDSITPFRSGDIVSPLPSLSWQKNFYDERIRDNEQYSKALHYVQGNAMKHGIVSEITDWPWTSVHFEQLLDPPELW